MKLKTAQTWIVAACVGTSFWMGCGDKPAAEGNAQAGAATATESVAGPRWLLVNYDDMRLRAAPDMKGEVVATLKEGTKVKDLRKQSENVEFVELRSRTISAPWCQVETADGKQGWMFGGALGLAPVPEADAFGKQLDAIATKDCKAVQEGLDLYAEAMKGKSQDVADMAMVPLNFHLVRAASNAYEATNLLPETERAAIEALGYIEPGKKHDEKALAQKKAWEDCGLRVNFPEGMLWLDVQPGLANLTAKPFVSPVMLEYLELQAADDTEIWTEDGGLTISPTDLAKRVIAWDKFMVAHPIFPFIEEIRANHHSYLGSLLGGMDNTPAFSYEGNTVEPGFKSAWELVMKELPGSYSAKVVGEWVDIVKKAGWKSNAETTKYTTKFWNAEG